MKKSVSLVIWQTIKHHTWLSLGILCAAFGAIGMALLPPLLLGMLIDRLAQGEELPLGLAVLYFIFLALTGISESFRGGLLTVFGQKITHGLRSELMKKYIRLTTNTLTKQEPGTVVSRFVGDVDTVETLFTSGIISLFADGCKILSILAVIWFRNEGLALVLLVVLPGLFWFTRQVQKRMLAAQIENRRAIGQASGYVPETVKNIRTIHCLGKEKYMAQRYNRAIVHSFQAVTKTNFLDAVYSPVILVLNALVVAVVMLFSASGNSDILTLFGMSAGTAVAVINYISQIFTPVESLGMEIQTIQSAVAGVHRINEFFQLPEQPKKEGGRVSCEKQEGQPLVEFRHVTFAYEQAAGQEVLKNVSFSVKEGEQVTLQGRTGAGKSTIFKLLLGLYEPKAGEVLLQGLPASQIEAQNRRHVYGYVEQNFQAVPGTVKDQITLYDLSISMEAVKQAAERVGLSRVIENLEQGYDTPCTPDLFSQGQWQLLCIARATVANPKLLLLDEITASMDAQTEKEVLEALKRSSENRTVISISHRVQARTGRIIEITGETG